MRIRIGSEINKLLKIVVAVCILMDAGSLHGGITHVPAGDLEAGFRNPTRDSGISCHWWWLNNNVTKEAITRDLEEMADKGYRGALIESCGGGQVPAGPVFGSPEWTDLFVHSCKEAKRLGLELSLTIQSGWNLGGPKVSAEDAAQRLIWSKTEVDGPAQVKRKLARPSGVRDGFYRDVAVLAAPLRGASRSTAKIDWTISASSTQQKQYPPSHAADQDPSTFWVSENGPTVKQPQSITLELSESTDLSAVQVLGRQGYGPRDCEIQLSMDDENFQTVEKATLKNGEMYSAEFRERQAKFVRVLAFSAFDPNPVDDIARNVQIAEVFLPELMGGMSRPIANLTLKSATREIGGSAPDCRFLLNTSPALPWELAVESGDIIDISDKMGKDGILRWSAPAGKWAILCFGHTYTGAHVSTSAVGWDGRVVDFLDPASLRKYWARNVAPLLYAIGPLAGSSLRYVCTGSWEAGGINWTPGFDEAFRQKRGYNPLPWLAVLTGYVVDSREASNAFLADFRKTIGDLVAEHYALLTELADKHGMGTLPESAGPHAGPFDGLKNFGRSEVVLGEFWARSPIHRVGSENRFFVKQAASAAHTYGKRLVGAEAFTTIGTHWNVVPWSNMKPSFDHEFCDGLNFVFHHTFTCSPKEMGIPGQEYFAGTHFNPQITWWQETPAFIDYIRRCQYLAQRGDFVADVVHYYGDHVPNIGRRKADDPAGALPGFDYDLLSEELLLESLSVEDGRLRLPSGMAYRVLTLPDHRVLSLGALEKVDALVRAGATVLGPKPLRAVSLVGGAEGRARFGQLADGLWGEGESPESAKGVRKVGKGRIAWGMTAREFLLSDGVAPDVTFQEPSKHSDVEWIHYRIGDAEVYFLANLKSERKDFTAIFRTNGRLPELWNAVDGAMREAATFRFVDGRTQLPLKFDPYDSMFVVFRKSAKEGRGDGPNHPEWKVLDSVAGPWEVRFDPDWGGPEKPVRFEELKSWIASNDPGIKHYSGKARYSTQFRINQKHIADGRPLAIELGKVEDLGIARVTVNGKDLGVVWRPPFRVEIAEAVKPGTNRLEVEVVNSWRNRLLYDSKLPEDERLTHTNITMKDVGSRNWILEESGLLGPVTLSVQEKGMKR